jgi:hypothetical protein
MIDRVTAADALDGYDGRNGEAFHRSSGEHPEDGVSVLRAEKKVLNARRRSRDVKRSGT